MNKIWHGKWKHLKKEKEKQKTKQNKTKDSAVRYCKSDCERHELNLTQKCGVHMTGKTEHLLHFPLNIQNDVGNCHSNWTFVLHFGNKWQILDFFMTDDGSQYISDSSGLQRDFKPLLSQFCKWHTLFGIDAEPYFDALYNYMYFKERGENGWEKCIARSHGLI